MNKIFCIKMGSSENRKKICQKYLSPESKKSGIMLGFNEADEESINKAIDAELALESNASDEEKIKCWKDVDESIMQCVNKTNDKIKPMTVTKARNVIRNVCMADESDIFFTFYDGFLWWCKPLGGPGEEIEFCKEMVIENNRIHSAGVLLPLTEDPKLSWKYGTRHRAAIGMSEVSDAACLVVSEETGDVSVTMDGILKKYEDLMTLKTDLESILGIKPKDDGQEKHRNIFEILRGKNK